MKVLGEAKAFSENCRIYRRTPRARVFKRKYISGRGDFSFYKPRNKELAQKNFLFCSFRFQSRKVFTRIALN